MLSEEELNGIKERWKNATKGPWEWSLNERAKSLILSNRAGLIVMDFVRWGMQRASPRFRNSNVLMESPLAFAEVFPGREHHQDWCKRVNHPDAVAIENAPVDVSKLLQSHRELQAENASLREQLVKPLNDEPMADLIRGKCSEEDPEEDHCNADAILCGLLEKLGYTKTVEAYESIPKWYA